MRAIYMSLCLAALAGVAACGPAKPAEAPVHEDESPPPSSGKATAADSDTPTAPTPPPVAPPPPPGSGVPYDKEAVEVGLKRAARQVKANCGATTDEEGKATGPWGKTTVTVKLGHNGHSQGATIGPPYDGKPVGKCTVQAFAILTFPPFAGGDTTVDWPVEIVAPSGAH
jgi:hypothetical protein